jgi:hypothetical protein
MERKYNILWIDDKHEELSGFKLQALGNNIILNSYKSRIAGMEELSKNYPLYDAVLLDAKFFDDEDDAAGSEDLSALIKAKDSLLQLPKKFELFVLTGQAQLHEDPTFNIFIPKYFRKGIAEDINKLFVELKQSADKQVDTQTRHNHQEIFSIFADGYLPAEIEIQVLELIKAELPENRFEIKSMLTNIRSIHESCFLKLEEIGVILDSTAKFNTIIKHLSGNKDSSNGFKSTTKEYQNDAIENLNKWLYFTCGKYIHNLKDENYNGYMISKYAVESLRTGLLELLLWFKKTYAENKKAL